MITCPTKHTLTSARCVVNRVASSKPTVQAFLFVSIRCAPTVDFAICSTKPTVAVAFVKSNSIDTVSVPRATLLAGAIINVVPAISSIVPSVAHTSVISNVILAIPVAAIYGCTIVNVCFTIITRKPNVAIATVRVNAILASSSPSAVRFGCVSTIINISLTIVSCVTCVACARVA